MKVLVSMLMLIVLLPAALIWSVNAVWGTHTPITLNTMLAALVFLLLLGNPIRITYK